MNDWARTRKRIIMIIVFVVLATLVGVPFYFFFYQKPTCSDAKMNGDETGTDCGGSCQRLCSPEALPLLLKGDPRILTIASDTYEVVALVENPNAGAEIYRAEYTLKLYSSSSALPVKTLEGFTFIPKNGTSALFEGPFVLSTGVVPTRATLEWRAESLLWKKNAQNLPNIEVKDAVLTNASTTPRLAALAENSSLERVANVDFVALLSDAEGNIFAASKTYISTLLPGETEPVLFSWPRPLTSSTADIEILVKVLPDGSFVR